MDHKGQTMTEPELVCDLTHNPFSRPLSCDQSDKLEHVLADYLERLELGEAPDTNTILAEYPELADELRVNFAKLAALHRAAVGMTDRGETLDQLCLSNFTEQRTLGDFRLIRPIGRGGMGVVYEAEQISLARRVALKTLPLAAVLDPKQLARFKNEAQAAASLDHPHIVSVYAVGVDRGAHYYAMRFIEGLSLAEVVQKLGARSEERGAESSGVEPQGSSGVEQQSSDDSTTPLLHSRSSELPAPRSPLPADTRPIAALSTLKITRPAEYFRNVARLGIQAAEALHYAHEMGVVHRDVKPSNLLLDGEGQLYVADFGLAMTQGDSNLTVTGDLLGTLRYMSPEQASGRRALVDRRTDIYSLGASLYELATLRPAFPEEDRQRLLQQIITDPPQLPSQINRTVPKDLETIILTTMSKEPTERYTTAQDLAYDLHRFLNDEPIGAKRPSTTERIAKWSRRHRTLVASAFVMLFLSVAGLSVGALLISQQRDAARAAASDARTQRSRAEGNLRQARAAVDKMYSKVAEELADRPHMEQLRRQLLEEALQFYQGFLRESDEDPEVRYETALVHGRMLDMYLTVGEIGKCLEQAQAQHRIALALTKEFPKETRYRELLAHGSASVGKVLVYLNQSDGVMYLDDALAEWTHLAAAHSYNPLYRKEIVAWHFIFLSREQDTSNPADGVRQAKKGLRLLDEFERDFPSYPKDYVLRAKGHHLLAHNLLELSECAEAEVHYRTAMKLDDDNDCSYKLTELLLMRGALDEAEDVLRKSIAKYERLRQQHPDSHSPDLELSRLHGRLSETLMTADRWEEAERAARRRLEICTDWYERFPTEKYYRNGITWSFYDLGYVLIGAGKHQEAKDAYQRGVTMLAALAKDFPRSPVFQNNMAWMLSTCPVEQLRDPSRAVEYAQRALQLSPDNADYLATMARAQYVAGDYQAAIASTENARQLFDNSLPSDAKLVLAMAHFQLGDSHRGHEIYRETVDELENKNTYSYWYTMEFRVLRTDADQMFAVPPP
jgi:serine/threonine protein kinase